MVKTHGLNLFENAIDSLIEAFSRYEEGFKGDPKAFKFAVLHMAHFIELIFKNHIASVHENLIYSNPFAQKLDVNKTINLWDAVNFITNDDPSQISKELRKDLDWLKSLRNQIEHHKFEMDVDEVRLTLGRLFRAVNEFIYDYGDVQLEKHLPPTALATFKALSDEYAFNVREAVRIADEIEREADSGRYKEPDAAPVRIVCGSCGNNTMVANGKSSTGFECLVCKSQDGDDIPTNCDICGVRTTRGELSNWGVDGERELRCHYCTGQYSADRDNS